MLIKKILRYFLKKEKRKMPPGYNGLIDTYVPAFVTIGDNFISAPGAVILAHDASTIIHSNKLRVEKTVIENDVFIGANAVVLPGVTIGNGVIVGAGAVVKKNIEDNMVVAGNPAKVICSVEEYIKKCESRAVLYNIPQSILEKRKRKEYLSSVDIESHQKAILEEYIKKSNFKN